MASTLCQKWLTIFGKKLKILYTSRPYHFIRISSACRPDTYQICMERLYTFSVSISNDNVKCPIGNSVFAVNLPLKLLRAIVVNADVGSLKSLHTFLSICL